MASLRINALTDELISIIVGTEDKSSSRFKKSRFLVDKTLKQNTAGRIDKFEVSRRLDGLQEKFQVVGNGSLSDALRLRLAELETKRFRLAPEALQLLLQLSDRPATKSKAENVSPAKWPDLSPRLTWSDLNDPENREPEDLWKDIDYAAVSSDDDISLASSDISIPRIIPQSSKIPANEYTPPDDIFVNVENENIISSIQHAQSSRQPPDPASESSNTFLTELQVIRETIFMLQGLPNSLFLLLDSSIEVDSRFQMHHASRQTLGALLRSFGDIGTGIHSLRKFVTTAQNVPFLQTFQRETEDLLCTFDRFLSNAQTQYFLHGQSPAISLLHLFNDVQREAQLLLELGLLVRKFDHHSAPECVYCLDLLYDLVYAKQAAGEDASFKIATKLFFKCFESYMKPIQLWMATGELNKALGSFFVRDARGSHDLKKLWDDWFELEGIPSQPHSPKFLQPAAEKIFTTGKSMVFLGHLGVLPERLNLTTQPSFTYEDICPADSLLLAPFSGLLQGVFERLVNAHHIAASSALRAQLDERCGLWHSIQALEHIYLGADIALSSLVDHRIFELIDKGRQSWNDRFLLREIVQQAFGSLPFVDASRLVARSARVPHREFEKYRRSVKILKALSVDYVLPWPVANIVSGETLRTYQRISTFLMQFRRAKYVVERQCQNKPPFLRVESYSKVDILAFGVRYQLLWFLNLFYNHFTELVIATSVAKMKTATAQAKDVDGMIRAHQSFISSVEDQCILSKHLAPIHQTIVSVLDLCLHFANIQISRRNEYQYDQGNQTFNESILRVPPGDQDTSQEDLSSSEDGECDAGNMTFEEGNSTIVSFVESSYRQRLLGVKERFERHCNFIKAGVSGVGPVDEQQSWEILADKLEWKPDKLG